MKPLKAIGLCLASMLVMGMALAGTASAAGPLWLVCLKGVGLTKYENSKCLKASGEPNSSEGWQSLGVASGQVITVAMRPLTITMKDTKFPIIGETGIQCYPKGGRGEGAIEEGGKGKIRVLQYEKAKEDCRGLKGCEEIEEIIGRDLPWKVEVFETENRFLTKIKNSGSGEPGWRVKCHTIIGSLTDECESESEEKSEQVRLENKVVNEVLLVRAEFEKLGKQKCSQGGSEAGTIEGQFTISLGGGALSVTPR